MTGTAHAGAVLTIDLAAIQQNYELLRDMAPGAECAALVKANAYGTGADRVGPALWDAGCRIYFTATLDEAIAFRGFVGPDARIFVLNGVFENEAEEFSAHDLAPVLNDLGQILFWSQRARTLERPLPTAIHFDTGMSRLGLPSDEAQRLADDPSSMDGLSVSYLMSHLIASEVPDDPVNGQQLARFNSLRATLPSFPASIANSSGIFLGADFHLDLVRPGVALYGANPQPSSANPMAEVIQLKAKILQVRLVDSPQTVGYGATHRVSGPTRIATIPVGYADGYPRSLSGRGYCYVGGIQVPVVGRVSMDLITLDVTAVPSDQVFPGAEVVVMGGEISLDALADAGGTIAYELLTALSGRYRREYIFDAGRT